jgi:hypothetical protein
VRKDDTATRHILLQLQWSMRVVVVVVVVRGGIYVPLSARLAGNSSFTTIENT